MIRVHSNEPVDIWSIDKKKDNQQNGTSEQTIINDSDNLKSIIMSDTIETKIEEDNLNKKNKIVGLYDPSENGFKLNMWNKSDPKKVVELANKINKMNLSEDAKKIYTKILLTNTYSPSNPKDKKSFFNIKSDWLIKNGDIDLISNYVIKNINIIPNEKLIKFTLNELFSENKIKQACKILQEIKISFNDKYLKNFSLYCLLFSKKTEEALLRYDLEKDEGYNDAFFEKKFQYLIGYSEKELSTSDKDLLSLHLSFLTNKDFSYVPSEKTPKLFWRYLSSNNLLDSVNEVDLEDENKIALIEKATHDKNFEEKELLNLYKRFQFRIDQLINIETEYLQMSKVKGRALLYQGILLSTNANTTIKLSKTLKESFIEDNIPKAFEKELKKILLNFKMEDLSSDLTGFYTEIVEEDKNNQKIKFNNKILHQSKLVKYFGNEKVSDKKIEKDLNNHLKKIKKSKKNLLITKDIILIEAMESDGINIKDDLKYLYIAKENYMPTDIQVLINDDEIGMASLRLVEIIGQDNINDLGSETLYFIINALNQMDIDPIRNEILYSILPLRA